MKKNEWFNYLKQNQINFPSSVYVKKIGYVSSATLKIKINEKNICNIGVEELTEKFNNSLASSLIWPIFSSLMINSFTEFESFKFLL